MEYIIGDKTLKYRIEQGTFPFSISKDFTAFLFRLAEIVISLARFSKIQLIISWLISVKNLVFDYC